MQASRLVAVVIVALLGGAAVWSLRSGRETEPRAVAAPTVSVSTVPASVAAESVPVTEATPSSAVPRADDPGAVAAEGLAAWGRFAVTGDLAEMSGLFAADGPQMTRFEEEAGGFDRVDGPAYSVTFTEEERDVSGDEARLSGIVRFVRTGEPTQSFDWTIVLHRKDEEWTIWTVEETEPAAG